MARLPPQGDRLKEAQNINKSLSALGDVIQVWGSIGGREGGRGTTKWGEAA